MDLSVLKEVLRVDETFYVTNGAWRACSLEFQLND
jgi:hypothetical protein